jgi:2-hydroxy-3-keto-5-methylthiopentenyl-1-phosphate phosphatase
MNLSPIMVRSQAVETPIFQRRTDRKRPILPQGPQRQGKLELPILNGYFDVDKTLTKAYMQNDFLLPALGFETPDHLWSQIPMGTANNVTTYMTMLKGIADEKGLHHILSPEQLQAFGKRIPMAPGATTFMSRLKKFAISLGLPTEVTFISSGLEEMIKAHPIARGVNVRANLFEYDRNGNVIGFERIIEDRDKPRHIKESLKNGQFLFYVGDGETDKKAWELAINRQADSIVVYDPFDPEHRAKADGYLNDGIVHASLPRDYRAGAPIDLYLRGLLVTERVRAESKPKLFA